MVRNLPAGAQRTVSFTPWPIGPPGAYTTACSTAWIPDMNNANNRRTSQFWVQLCDISVESIISPLVVVDSAETIPVQAAVRNRGTSTKNFRTVFRIGTFYNDTVSVTLPPDSGRIVTFDNWIATQPEAVYPVQCTTVIVNDINDVNNQIIDSVRIRVYDVAVESIISPPPVIQPGLVTPQTRVRNNGGDLASFDAVFSIISDTGIIYSDTVYVNNLIPDSSFDVSFIAWNATVGTYIARCSVSESLDMISANDTMSLIFMVAVRDVGVSRIVYPGSRTLLGPIQPRTTVRNYSSISESFWTWMRINETSSGLVVYFDSVFCTNVGPWLERIVDFPRWDTVSLGDYTLTSYTAMPGDLNPTNDIAISYCSVESIILPRWAPRANMPEGPRNRPVKRGGCITYAGGDNIYALKGSNTNEFYYYNITSDSWARRDTVPFSVVKRRRIKRGAALCYDGVDIIYALKGSNTLEFWAYYINGDSWRQLRDVPVGAKKVKGGTGLAYVTGTPQGDLVYCLKGSNTLEFYAYVVAADSWMRMSDVPPGPRSRRMYYGSCITYDPSDNTIYALKGRENEFFKYYVSTDSWEARSPMPFVGLERAKRVKYGASLAADGAGQIFAFKGNKTQEFWIYHTTEDWWEQTEPIPLGLSGRKVKHGGCLCYSTFDDKVYAMKGNRTLEFWSFDASALSLAWTPPEPDLSSGAMEAETRPLDLIQFRVIPNPNNGQFTLRYKLAKPGMIEFKLYNVLGEVVFRKTTHSSNSSGEVLIDAKTLASGIYVVRIENGGYSIEEKLLIQK